MHFSSKFSFEDNSKTLSILQGPTRDSPSILNTLNEVCRQDTAAAKATGLKKAALQVAGTQRLLKAIEKDFKEPVHYPLKIEKGRRKGATMENPFAVTEHTKKFGSAFMLRHYAADVVYDVGGWVDKNRDLVTQEQYDCIATSTQGMFQGFLNGRQDLMERLDGTALIEDGSVLCLGVHEQGKDPVAQLRPSDGSLDASADEYLAIPGKAQVRCPPEDGEAKLRAQLHYDSEVLRDSTLSIKLRLRAEHEDVSGECKATATLVLKIPARFRVKVSPGVHLKITATRAAGLLSASLDEALTALHDALKKVDQLRQSDIADVMDHASPPPRIRAVMAAVCIYLKQKPSQVPDPNDPRISMDDYWHQSKVLLGKTDFIATSLRDYDKDSIPEEVIVKIKTYVEDEDLQNDKVEAASVAASALMRWVRAMYHYHFASKRVQPLRQGFDSAVQSLRSLSVEDLASLKQYGLMHMEDDRESVQRVSWAVSILMGVDAPFSAVTSASFLAELESYDKERISPEQLNQLRRHVADDRFTPQYMGKISKAAGALCRWVLAVYAYGCASERMETNRVVVADTAWGAADLPSDARLRETTLIAPGTYTFVLQMEQHIDRLSDLLCCSFCYLNVILASRSQSSELLYKLSMVSKPFGIAFMGTLQLCNHFLHRLHFCGHCMICTHGKHPLAECPTELRLCTDHLWLEYGTIEVVSNAVHHMRGNSVLAEIDQSR